MHAWMHSALVASHRFSAKPTKNKQSTNQLSNQPTNQATDRPTNKPTKFLWSRALKSKVEKASLYSALSTACQEREKLSCWNGFHFMSNIAQVGCRKPARLAPKPPNWMLKSPQNPPQEVSWRCLGGSLGGVLGMSSELLGEALGFLGGSCPQDGSKSRK